MISKKMVLKRLAPMLLASVFVLPALAAETGVIRLSEPVEVTDSYEVFGSNPSDSGKKVSLESLVANSDAYQGQEVLVETRIAKVCQKKGCFFIAQSGADSVRITFEDYGFFIPTDSGGKQVMLAGVFSRKPVSAEQAEHLAEDLGEKVAEDAPAFEYSIVATGIKIYKS